MEKIAESPIALRVPQMKRPRLFPMIEYSAALEPPKIDCRKTIATPWPGTAARRNVVNTKVGIFASSDEIILSHLLIT